MGEVEDNGPALSEDENEMNLINVKSHKRPKILDSDSDSETAKTATKVSEDGPSQQSNDDEDIISHSDSENAQKIKRKSKFILPSDGETSEDEISPHNKSFPDEETAVEAIIYTTNNKGELVPENATNPIQKSCLSSLWDPESSEDEQEVQKSAPPEYENARVPKSKQQKPTRKAKTKEDKPKKMTPRDAVQQRIEIQSESQRMVRESNVSLPYHKPKSYTLKEFLEKRSKLVNAASIIAKAPVAMKMSKDQLEEVSRKVDERIKQVEEFYKSESDEDEEEESEIASKEIRGWLDCLVDNAVDSVENKMDELLTDECGEKMDIETNKTPDDQQFSEDYEFNLDDINEPEPPKRPKIADLLKEKLNIQPRLSGCPDDIIDLDEGVTKPSAVKRLVEKFFQHTAKKISHKHKVELNIVGVTGGGEIVKETVSMNVDEEDEPVIVETPGAKLQKLRAELQSQMALKRSELWKQKQEQGDTLLIEKTIDDGGDNEKEKDILDDDDEEEEIEMTESESDEEMEEAEEDYNLKSEKPKCAFLDDEADEDDMEEENEDADNINEDKEDENEEENDTDENNGFDGDDEEIPDGETSAPSKKKILKRIIKPFTEDSDDDEDGEKPMLIPPNPPKESLNSTATASSEDDIIPPNLPRTDLTPQRHVMAKEKTDFEFLTPVSFLTGLQNLNSTDKFSKESPVISPFRQPFEPSPLKDSKFHKKLFSEQFESSQDSQSNIENLAAAMCSGNFPQSQVEIETHEDKSEEMAPSTQDLLNICSGGFANDTSNETREATEKVVINIQTNPDNEIKSLDEDNDQIISQLLDEEELERFKKKFESPVTNQLNVSHSFGDAEEVNATGLINSDDENEGLEIKTKKKQKKLVFSDDEETSEQDEEVEQEDEEEIDLHDTDDEEQLMENEIKAQESGLYRPSDFLDKEAELSESEWGSADEDEKGLDELEFEQGDEETFNENKVRSELERIHMRQVLDDDNREVKLLQELLLEDGEMHGAGRQRQFRWKALDSLDNSGFEKRDDDDIYLDEEDNEEEFRKMRHKREMFLKKKSTEDDVDSILSDSQILKMGQQVFKSSQSSSSQNNTPINKTEVKEKEPFSLLSKRGSFLSRNDQVLQRLAEYNKVTESVTGNTARNSRCFVFQTVETIETVQMKNNNNNKRKASDGTPNAIKKLRLTSNFSPANTSKKQSGKAGGAKKLFGNW